MTAMDFNPAPLASAILNQAFEDYESLRRKGISEKLNKDRGDYSVDELMQFFGSKWCRDLILLANN